MVLKINNVCLIEPELREISLSLPSWMATRADPPMKLGHLKLAPQRLLIILGSSWPCTLTSSFHIHVLLGGEQPGERKDWAFRAIEVLGLPLLARTLLSLMECCCQHKDVL